MTLHITSSMSYQRTLGYTLKDLISVLVRRELIRLGIYMIRVNRRGGGNVIGKVESLMGGAKREVNDVLETKVEYEIKMMGRMEIRTKHRAKRGCVAN